MITNITMKLSNREAIALNNLWFEMFGEYTTIDSMDKIEIYITSRESGESMIIETRSGEIGIDINLEASSFFKILAGIELVTNYMPSESVPAESIRQAIRNFHEVFGKNPMYRLCVDGAWMCESHDECNYEEGDEYRCIYDHYERRLRMEGYDEDYIEANLMDYVSCRLFGSKLFMQAKNSGMLGELLGEDLNPIHKPDAEELCED